MVYHRRHIDRPSHRNCRRVGPARFASRLKRRSWIAAIARNLWQSGKRSSNLPFSFSLADLGSLYYLAPKTASLSAMSASSTFPSQRRVLRLPPAS
jgi:hypothetical protein